MDRHSTHSMRSRDGPPGSASRACRLEPGMRAYSISRGERTARLTAKTSSRHDLTLTKLSTHLEGQLVAVHPAYDVAFRRILSVLAFVQLASIRLWVRVIEYTARRGTKTSRLSALFFRRLRGQ